MRGGLHLEDVPDAECQRLLGPRRRPPEDLPVVQSVSRHNPVCIGVPPVVPVPVRGEIRRVGIRQGRGQLVAYPLDAEHVRLKHPVHLCARLDREVIVADRGDVVHVVIDGLVRRGVDYDFVVFIVPLFGVVE